MAGRTRDGQDTTSAAANPANLLGLDYRAAFPPPVCPIIDVHTHVHLCEQTGTFLAAANHFGIDTIVSMSPLEDVPELRRRYGRRLRFIAIPRWRQFEVSDAFRAQWIRDLAAFREHGATLCKFWCAPRMRAEHGLTLDHAFLRPVIDAALELGYDFMVHVADPSVWWRPGKPYADAARFGSKAEQFDPLEWFAEYVAPRRVVAAHMAGSIEEPPRLDALLARHDNLLCDTSATKWIVREVARRPDEVRALMLRHSDRILFGSDLVVRDEYKGFDHYASRYWAQRTMWETDDRGLSPIADPDAEGDPQLAGLALPEDVLRKLYRTNAERLLQGE